MNLLIVGGCHTYGYGVAQEHGFVQQLINRITGEINSTPRVRYVAPAKLNKVAALLLEQPHWFDQADLILLQVGHYELSWRDRFHDLARVCTPADRLGYGSASPSFQATTIQALRGRFLTDPAVCEPTVSSLDLFRVTIKTALLEAYRLAGGELPLIRHLRETLSPVVDRLSPYQDRVLILTPFPCLTGVDHWLRQQGQSIFREEAHRADLAVVDTFSGIPRLPANFLPDGVHLNEVGHAIVASRLWERVVNHPVLSRQRRTNDLTESRAENGHNESSSTVRFCATPQVFQSVYI